MKSKPLDLATNAKRPLARAGLLLFTVLAAVSPAAASVNLLTNGDFAQTHPLVLSSNPMPTAWSNLGSNTDNVGFYNGALLFSTAGNDVSAQHYYVYQEFDTGTDGAFVLTERLPMSCGRSRVSSIPPLLALLPRRTSPTISLSPAALPPKARASTASK